MLKSNISKSLQSTKKSSQNIKDKWNKLADIKANIASTSLKHMQEKHDLEINNAKEKHKLEVQKLNLEIAILKKKLDKENNCNFCNNCNKLN